MNADLDGLIDRKLAMLGIDEAATAALRQSASTVEVALPGIIERFYLHLQTFPDARRVLNRMSSIDTLKKRQEEHWAALFKHPLDAQYVRRALRVGEAHYRAKVAPYLYIAGYNFVQCEILSVLSEKHRAHQDLSLILTAATRVISLDMDLSISVYTRALWRSQADTVQI